MFMSKTIAVAVAALCAQSVQVLAADLDILNYALTLENLENAFYEAGLKNFTSDDFKKAGYASDVRDTFVRIGSDEMTHVSFLNTAINASYPGKAVPACKYVFPVTDVKSFIQVATALENTGVAAYDGAINAINNSDYKTAAASIATVEARHASYLNSLAKVAITTGPFDTPLNSQSIISIAGQFITSCPYTLPAKPFPALMADLTSGNSSSLTIASSVLANSNTTNSTMYCHFVYGLTQTAIPVTSKKNVYSCALPADSVAYTTVVVFLTNANSTLTLDNANNGIVLAGPSLIALNNTVAKLTQSKFESASSASTLKASALGLAAVGLMTLVLA